MFGIGLVFLSFSWIIWHGKVNAQKAATDPTPSAEEASASPLGDAPEESPGKEE
jgi:hypothetical protein